MTDPNDAEEHARALTLEFDGLTGLANRVLLHERLERAIRGSGRARARCALLVLDLDRFGALNDILGHTAGDSVLQQVAQRMQAVVLATGLVARLGDDEFGVLLPEADATRAAEVADSLARAMHAPFMLQNQPIVVEASIGIALAPEHGPDAGRLLCCAAAAMDQAKRSGIGVAMYGRAHDEHRLDRLGLLVDLSQAIERHELRVHYQPKLYLHDGTLAGVEALVRWQHPRYGFLSPGEFMPLAELSGLIRPLSVWVLEAALRQHQAWRGLGMDIPVAVNLPRRMLHDRGLPGTVARLLSRWGVPPDAVVLEIAEISQMFDPLRAGETLNQLRALGLGISMDDFGTGYSSLASLKNLSVDELKIDQSFVRGMATDASARAIVRAIIDLADGLKVRVVAEGVEDRATWDILVGLGCDAAQGYFLSPALAAVELQEWVALVSPAWLESAARPVAAESLRERIRVRGARLTAEEEFIARKEAEAALGASEERNRLALQAAHMGTWDVDLVRHTHAWSSETQALLGLPPGTAEGKLVILQSAVHPEDWPALDHEWKTAVAERRGFSATYRTVWPDGSVHWIEDNGRALYAADGTPVRMTGTSIDVTERMQAEKQREAMARSEKLRALGQMASGIAHDLNQSLMLVASYSELARLALGHDPPNLVDLEDLLTTTREAALHGGETVKRLLLFTRAAPEHDGQLVDLSSMVRDAAQLTAPRWRDAVQAEGRRINLSVETADSPTIQGSPGQLRELMTNLIFNAVDALPNGGTIRLRVVTADEQGIVEVTDSGVGMSPEVQARVFEPFYTTKGERGTGLGLAMVFGIVQQHGGQIDVRSSPGEGTTFRMSFPRVDAIAAVGQPPTPLARLEPARPLRVLAVDDEPMMTRAVERILRPSGHLVSVAASGEEALAKLAEQTFDVVVSDLGMGPGINGWELAEAVKRRWPSVCFLLATGWGAGIDPGEAQSRGVDAILSKPYHPDDLVRALALHSAPK